MLNQGYVMGFFKGSEVLFNDEYLGFMVLNKNVIN